MVVTEQNEVYGAQVEVTLHWILFYVVLNF